MLLDIAMDEQQELENEQINLMKYPIDWNHKMQNKLSGSLSDSGHLLANIRGQNLAKIKFKQQKQKNENLNQEYLTYNAINFGSSKRKTVGRVEIWEDKHWSKSSRSLKQNSESISSSNKKKNIASRNSLSKNSAHSVKKENNKISLTSIIPSTLNSIQSSQKVIGLK